MSFQKLSIGRAPVLLRGLQFYKGLVRIPNAFEHKAKTLNRQCLQAVYGEIALRVCSILGFLVSDANKEKKLARSDPSRTFTYSVL
jgi:hypothetical protein